MVETLAMAESKSSQPSPPRCPLVRSHSLRRVPLISLGFTTGLPRWPFPKVEGGGVISLLMLHTSNLRCINSLINRTSFQKLPVGSEAHNMAVFHT